MQYNPANPLIVQGDRTILLEVDNPLHAEARDAIAPFAELEKSPEHIHTYRLTPLSLWNAAAAGMSADAMIEALETYSQVPAARQPAGRPPRAGQPLRPGPAAAGRRPAPADHRRTGRCWKSWRGSAGCATTWASGSTRPASPSTTPTAGVLKQALIAVGYPAEDLAGYTDRGGACRWRSARSTRSGLPFRVRDYQEGAVAAFYAGGDVRGGSGVIVLPCGAGKTIVGLAAMAALKTETLDPDHQHHRRRAVEARDPRQDRPRPVAGRHLHRRLQDARAGHPGHLPDRHLPAQEGRRLPPLPPVRRARLGADHLRRGPPAPRAGVPDHGRHPGPPPARA